MQIDNSSDESETICMHNLRVIMIISLALLALFIPICIIAWSYANKSTWVVTQSTCTILELTQINPSDIYIYNVRCSFTPNRISTLWASNYYPINATVLSSRGVFGYNLLMVFTCYDTVSLTGDIWVSYIIENCYDHRSYSCLAIGVACLFIIFVVISNFIFALCRYRSLQYKIKPSSWF